MPATASRTDPAHSTADALPVDVDTIRATVKRALEVGPTPRYSELVELEGLLRAHIGCLLPVAEAAVERLWKGSVEWYDRRSRLDAVRHSLALGMGDGLMSARRQVTRLACDCRALLAYVPAAGR